MRRHSRKPRHELLESRAVETHPVDDSLIFRQPKQTRLLISGLSLRRDSSTFNETETKLDQTPWNERVLVKACRKPNWIWKVDPAERRAQICKCARIKPGRETQSEPIQNNRSRQLRRKSPQDRKSRVSDDHDQ